MQHNVLIHAYENRHANIPARTEGDWYKIVNKKSDKDSAAKVYLYGSVGGWDGVEVNQFVKDLADVDASTIKLHINSPGGAVFDAIAIYNALKQHDAEVHTIIDGIAASAASFIAMAGETVTATRNATIMIHDAIAGCYGNRADMLETANLLDKVSNNIADIYAYNAGGTELEWRELMKAETWFTAAEARAVNLVDVVLDSDDSDDSDEDAPDKASNSWNLGGMFNYEGRKAAPSPFLLREKVRNQIKEASVGTEETNKEQEGQTSGATPVDDAATNVESSNESVTEEQSSSDANTSDVTNQANIVVVLNGEAVSNQRIIQDHVNALETHYRESVENERIGFVENLSRDNLISATQVGDRESGLIAFALGLTSEQFTAWKATFDAAPANTLFGEYGNTPGDAAAPGNEDENSIRDQIEVYESIVAQHKSRGMVQEELETKDSWNQLQALKAKLENK